MALSVFFLKLEMKAATIKHSGKCGDIEWSIDSNGLLVLAGNGDYATPNDDGMELPPWCWQYGEEVTSARIQIRNITSCENMLSGLTELKTLDLTGLDTSEVLDMQYMFDDCESLSSVNLKNFNTTKVTNMSFMFSGCNSLKKLDLSSFDVKNVESIYCMFSGCSSMEYLDLSSFNLCNYEGGWTKKNGSIDGFHENLLMDMKKLKQIKVPQNLSFSVKLPGATVWMDKNRNRYKELPRNKIQSCTLYSAISKGTTVLVSDWKCKVKVTSDFKNNLTVSYMKSTDKKASAIEIPDVVKINGITYKVTNIASNALANNKKITRIIVGKNVSAIGRNAFCGDKNLKFIIIKSSKLTSKSVGKNAFKGTNRKLTIKVPKKKVSLYKKFLKKKGNSKINVKKK